MIWIGVGLLAIWLLALTVVVAALVRYVATISLAQSAGAAPTIHTDFEAGPMPGSTLPGEVEEVLNELPAQGSAQRVLFFFTPGCGICIEIAREAVARQPVVEESTFFVVGADSARAGVVAELVEVLEPAGGVVVADARARSVMNALGIHSMPFVVVVRNGQVTSKLFAKRTTQLAELLDHVVLRPSGGAAEKVASSGMTDRDRR